MRTWSYFHAFYCIIPRKLNSDYFPIHLIPGSRYCWFRCQKLSDFGFAEGLTPENACLVSESKKLRFLEGNESDAGVATLKCANPRMQVHPTGKVHGDYYPVCTTNVRFANDITRLLSFGLSLILLPSCILFPDCRDASYHALPRH